MRARSTGPIREGCCAVDWAALGMTSELMIGTNGGTEAAPCEALDPQALVATRKIVLTAKKIT